MPTIAPISPQFVLDELHQSLDNVLTILNQKWTDTPLSLKPIGAPSVNAEQRSFQLTGRESFSVQIRFAAFPVGENSFEVQIQVEGGPIRCLTHAPSHDDEREETTSQLERKVTAFLLYEIEPLLGQRSGPLATKSNVPRIDLDREGTIQNINEAARSVLEYGPEEEIAPNFFSHVDGHNLRDVMEDMAEMVRRAMRRARWLLRLNTGKDRWRWYRAAVHNELRAEGTIRIHLRSLGKE